MRLLPFPLRNSALLELTSTLENMIPLAGTTQPLPDAQALENAGLLEADADEETPPLPVFPPPSTEPTVNGKPIKVGGGAQDHPGYLRTDRTVSCLWKKSQGKTKNYQIVAVRV